MKVSNLLVIAAYTSCMASFSWAMRRFFVKSTQPFNIEQRLIIYLGGLWAILQIAALCVAPPLEPLPTALSLLLCFTSLAIFWSAVQANRAQPLNWAFEPDKPRHLTAAGPYRWVRHPFYLSYMLCWVAPALATASLALLIPGTVMFILYWRASSREEDNFLNSPIAPQYRSYQAQAGRFWPKWHLGAN
jgi:protein-S-isoprenylcysteine O-methyltransferase Ste14